jgi:endogenous inhibitor of DNA gyrase (YacG/DUF329 family)
MAHSVYCKKCKTTITSERPGHFVTCECGAVSIDTDRWFPERYRIVGDFDDWEENNP